MQATVREYIKEDPLGGWEKAWRQSVTPWDTGYPQPPLRDLIESNIIPLPTTGKALVPGCGRGFDAIVIAEKLGLQTVGLDISTTGLQAAKENLAACTTIPAEKVTFKNEDFFTLKAETDDDKFDLIYDYTFFVAIQPARRPEWAEQMTALCKPGGYLITLVFPIDPPQDYGPPFYVRPEHYEQVLGSKWEKVLDKVPEVSSEVHVGREKLIVWRRL